MDINTVAILSPGDMGHAVGQLLREHELQVVTCLTGGAGERGHWPRKPGLRTCLISTKWSSSRT